MIEPERRTGCPPSQGFPESCRPDWGSVSTVHAHARAPSPYVVKDTMQSTYVVLMRILCVSVRVLGRTSGFA